MKVFKYTCLHNTSPHYSVPDSRFNPLMEALKLQSNGPLYSNTAIGTLAVKGWAVTFGTARRRLGSLRP